MHLSVTSKLLFVLLLEMIIIKIVILFPKKPYIVKKNFEIVCLLLLFKNHRNKDEH